MQTLRAVEIARAMFKAGQVDDPFTEPSSSPIAELAKRLHTIMDALDPSDVEWSALTEPERQFYFFSIVGLLDEPELVADAIAYKDDVYRRSSREK